MNRQPIDKSLNYYQGYCFFSLSCYKLGKSDPLSRLIISICWRKQQFTVLELDSLSLSSLKQM